MSDELPGLTYLGSTWGEEQLIVATLEGQLHRERVSDVRLELTDESTGVARRPAAATEVDRYIRGLVSRSGPDPIASELLPEDFEVRFRLVLREDRSVNLPYRRPQDTTLEGAMRIGAGVAAALRKHFRDGVLETRDGWSG